MTRFRSALLPIAAALAGYWLGSSRTTEAYAARDEAKELLETDRQFDAATAKDGLDGWVSYFAPDGIMMPAGTDMIIGQQAIRAYEEKAFAIPGFSLRWEPVDAGVSGTLGYTYGLFKVTRKGRDGQPASSYGKYVTIWRKQRDRTWRVAVDIGNASPAPAKPKEQ